MADVEGALSLANEGFFIIPLPKNRKFPIMKDWVSLATNNGEKILDWWTDPITKRMLDLNIGISTSHFGDGSHLVVLDIDIHKKGFDSLFKLQNIDDLDFPDTREHTTASGGLHILYKTKHKLRNSVEKIAEGVDIRAYGGCICAPGSTIDGNAYSITKAFPVAEAPRWLVDSCSRLEDVSQNPVTVDSYTVDSALRLARQYLDTAPVSVSGHGGDATAYIVACTLKNYGVPEADAVDMMFTIWNPKCTPPWTYEQIETKVHNAYTYSRGDLGSANPEAVFQTGLESLVIPSDTGMDNLEKLNKRYSFIKQGAFIICDTTDPDGERSVTYMTPQELHLFFANKKIVSGGRLRPISQVWMEWPGRREYEGLVFQPEAKPSRIWYNLWKGFSVATATVAHHAGLTLFLDHLFSNVCARDKKQYRWLLCYFAHLIQRPMEKPETTLVLKGRKGTGKNVVADVIGRLLGSHYLMVDKARYITSNFNCHFEKCLLIAFEEFSWGGDAEIDKALKALTTGKHHVIERKRQEIYKVQNITRVMLLSNENMVVPATEDERRYAVFEMSDGRKQDREYFGRMMRELSAGGYESLLLYLKQFNIDMDVNTAPSTDGLASQKLASLTSVHQWWVDSVTDNRLVGDIQERDLTHIFSAGDLARAYYRYARSRGIRGPYPTEIDVISQIFAIQPTAFRRAPEIHKRDDGEKTTVYKYKIVDRKNSIYDISKYIGKDIETEDTDNEDLLTCRV